MRLSSNTTNHVYTAVLRTNKPHRNNEAGHDAGRANPQCTAVILPPAAAGRLPATTEGFQCLLPRQLYADRRAHGQTARQYTYHACPDASRLSTPKRTAYCSYHHLLSSLELLIQQGNLWNRSDEHVVYKHPVFKHVANRGCGCPRRTNKSCLRQKTTYWSSSNKHGAHVDTFVVLMIVSLRLKALGPPHHAQKATGNGDMQLGNRTNGARDLYPWIKKKGSRAHGPTRKRRLSQRQGWAYIYTSDLFTNTATL